MTVKSLGQEGKALRALRQFKNLTQDAIADALDCTQQAVSDLEKREHLDEETKRILSKIFDVPVEAFENYSEDRAVNIIATTFTNTNNDQSAFIQTNQNPVFNSADKVVELYERMLKERDEKIAELSAELQKVKAGKK